MEQKGDKLLTSKEVCHHTGLSKARVGQLTPALIAAGLAKKYSRFYLYETGVVEWILSRPERRGRKKKDRE